MASSASYPYRGFGLLCKPFTPVFGPGVLSGHVDTGDENGLAVSVNSRPTSVAVDASSMQHYSGGILSGGCSDKLNHAVLVVGYGDGFWKIKNSWGGGWGEGGYVRLARGSNMCGVGNAGSYPVM